MQLVVRRHQHPRLALVAITNVDRALPVTTVSVGRPCRRSVLSGPTYLAVQRPVHPKQASTIASLVILDTSVRTTTAQCTAGWYCTSNATRSTPEDGVTGDKCPKGHECPTGSSAPSACQGGYFANSTGQASCYSCPAGYYCVPGAETPVPCPTGYYCPNNTASQFENECPKGAYLDTTLAHTIDDCIPFPPGTFSTL